MPDSPESPGSPEPDLGRLDPVDAVLGPPAEADGPSGDASTPAEPGQQGLDELLLRIARSAVAAVPEAEGAGLALLEAGRPVTVVASDPFVREIDDIQYALGQGPCVLAAVDGVTVRSGVLGTDERWPRFGRRVAELGVDSVLSLPLTAPAGAELVGTLNVYAHRQDAFGRRATELGEEFARPAAVAAQNARVAAASGQLSHRLQAALATRAVVNRAVGVLMSRSGSTAEAALGQLRHLCPPGGNLAETAQRVLDDAVRRARSRDDGH